MTTQTECPLTIEWEDLPASQRPRVIVEYSLESAFLTSTDAWSVTLYDDDPARLANLALAPVSLLIHGNRQLYGRVERVSRGGNGREVKIAGRDHLADIVECNVDPSVRVTEDMTLAQVVNFVASPCGISTVFGEADAQTRSIKSGAPLKAGKDQGFPSLVPGNLKPEPGMGIFDWLNRLAARQGCTIQPGPDRSSVILAAPNYDSKPIATFSRASDPRPARRNNIKSASADEDYSSFPTVGLVSGKVTTAGDAAKAAGSVRDITQGMPPALLRLIGSRILTKRIKPEAPGSADAKKLYRLLYVKDDEARKPEQVERSIARAVSERLRATLSYEVTVRGHRDPDSGYVFATDTMAQVKDDVCGIDEALWVASRTFTYSRGAGAESKLTLWRPGSFIL